MIKKLLILLALYIPLFAGTVQTDHAQVELISETGNIVPGQAFTVALHITHNDEWHTYWRNAGDAGIPTRFKWKLPDGFTAGPIEWPYPHRIMIADVANYGYEGDLYLLTEITPPSDLKPGQRVTIGLDATWLICRVECVPEGAELELTLPVGTETELNDETAEAFTATREKLPLVNSGWEVAFTGRTDTSLTSAITKPDWLDTFPGSVQFFPYDEGFIKNSAKQTFTPTDNGYNAELILDDFIVDEPDTLHGILVSETGWRGEGSEKAIEISVPLSVEEQASPAPGESNSLLLALIFAFAGGIMLNLMPCVLPVLSIKILGFAQQAGNDKKHILSHGIFFTVGVVASFLVLASLLLILREGGEQLGWGFQLQSPLFLIILSVLLTLFSMSLFGVFEIGTSAAGLGGRIENRGGSFGALLSGVAATVLATPCTAPFMGSALGFAITQPAYVTLTVFTSLGLGMAFPYLILSIFPQWLKYIPKPGTWMETLKQFMGFLLLATILWLAWVLSIQGGGLAVIGLMAALLITGLASWIYGKWGSLVNSKSKRVISFAVALVLVVGSVLVAESLVQPVSNSSSISNSDNGIQWEEFSKAKLEESLKTGDPVFVDFTAAWCLSCQVNEKVALNNEEVVNKMNELNAITLKADWTSRDPEITEALAKFGRNSVPLYVLYDGRSSSPKLLPEILTPGIVLEELDKL